MIKKHKIMERHFYTYKVYGKNGKLIGEVRADYVTEADMHLKVNGILEGASLFRANVKVVVFDENNEKVLEIRK